MLYIHNLYSIFRVAFSLRNVPLSTWISMKLHCFLFSVGFEYACNKITRMLNKNVITFYYIKNKLVYQIKKERLLLQP